MAKEKESTKTTNDLEQYEMITFESLVYSTQPLNERTIMNEPSNEMEKLIHYLEKVSPYQLLVDISDGLKPAPADLQTIENIMLKQKLAPGVVNVLIYYLMVKTDKTLPKKIIEKIATHWSRMKIKSVPQAMDFAKQEEKKFQEHNKIKDRMAKPSEDLHKELELTAWEEGKKEARKEIARRLFQDGIEVTYIKKVTTLSEQELIEIIQNQS